MTQVNIVHVLNPLDPRDSYREVRTIKPGQTLADLFPSGVITTKMIYSVNGQIIDDLSTATPQEGDWIVEMPEPQGSGAKKILRLVAIIAVAVYAPTLAAQLSYSMGGGMFLGSTLGLNMLAAGITLVGTALVNAMLPPPKPASQARGIEESPTYGIDGAKNTSAEGIIVPVVYGEFRMAGNIINNYVINDGSTQYLHMLINAGEGQIASIADVQINDQPITNYKDYIIETRLGTVDQTPLANFATTVTARSVGQTITDTYKVFQTSGTSDQLRLDIVAPTGLFYTKDDGSFSNASVTLDFQYRKIGDATWLPFTFSNQVTGYTTTNQYITYKNYDEFGNQIGGETPYVPTGSEVISGDTIYIQTPGEFGFTSEVVGTVVKTPIYGTTNGLVTITSNSRQAYRRSFISVTLPQGVYEVRYRRTTPTSTDNRTFDEVYLSDVNEIIQDVVTYKNTALLGLRIRLSDQLNGIPNITFLHGGKIVRVYNETTQSWVFEASKNPAWITLDILTNKRYGGGVPLSRIDLTKFRDWAQFCDDPYSNGLRKYEFSGVFDTQSNIWDAANEVARCGHASLIQLGTKFSVVIERAETPSMMFGMGNIVKGTFRENWLSMEERANEIEVTYYDKADNYTQHVVRVYDSAAIAAGDRQRVASVQMRGITTAQRAYEEGMLMLNMNKYILRTVEFSAPIEAIACTVGDVVYVQHDMPQWGYSGRLNSGSTTTVIQLDRPVLMEFGKTYSLLVLADTLTIATGTIAAINGNRVELTGFTYNASTPVKRLVVAGVDREVLDVFYNSTSLRWGVEVADATGLTVSAAYTLSDTNVIQTRGVVNPLGSGFAEYTQVTLSTPLPGAPAQYSKFSFGESTKVAKPFRIRSISGTDEYTRDITAIEYNASIYTINGAVPTINYSSLSAQYVQPVTIDGVYEETVLVGTDFETRVTVAYRSTAQTYQTAEVFVSRNSGPFESVGTDPAKVTIKAFAGENLTFQVVARDRFERNAAISTSPTSSYTVVGYTTALPAASGFGYSLAPGGVVFTWSDPTLTNRSYNYSELRQGASWAAGSKIWSGSAATALWVNPTPASYTVWLAHYNTAGVGSTPVSLAVTVDTTTVLPSISATLSADSFVLQANATGVVSSYAGAVSTIKVLRGTTDDTANWTISKADFNCTSSLTGATVTITGLTADQGYVDITATRTGYTSITKRFSLSKARTGADGANGTSGVNGTRTAILDLYKWSATQPVSNFPSGTSTYTWATGQFTAPATLNGWTTTPGAPVAGQTLYIARQIYADTGTSATSTVTWSVSASQPLGAAGTDGAAGSAGANGQRVGFLEVYQWAAAAPTTYPSGTSTYTWATGSFTAPTTPNGWSLTPGAAVTGQTLWAISVRVSDNLTTPTSTATWNSTTVYPVGAAGTNGANGNDATAYWLARSVAAVQKSIAGVYTPTSVTFSSFSATGSGAPAAYAGRFIIATSLDGTTYTNQYTSATNEASTTYSVPANIKTIRVRLYLAGGTTTLLDEEIVPIVTDGATGSAGSSGLNMVLSNEAHVLPADNAGVVGSFAGAVSTATIYQGTTDDTANWTFTQTPSNVTATASGTPANRTATITAMSADTGYVDFTATRSGYPTLTGRFTLAKARAGAQGATGPTGPSGSAGQRGTVTLAAATTGSVWVDSEANSALTSRGYGSPVVFDVVTLYNSSTGFSETRYWSGSAWTALAAFFGGNVLVDGTLSARKLRVAGTQGYNKWVDPNYADIDAWTTSNWGAVPVQANVTDGKVGGNVARSITGGMSSARGSRRIEVEVGKSYLISCWARRSATANGTLYLRIDTGTTVSSAYTEGYIGIEGVTPGTSWTYYSGVWVATTPFVSPMILLNYVGSAGYHEVQGISIEEQIDSALVVDGGITASKVDTRNLTIKDGSGNVIFGSGATVNAASYMQPSSNWVNDNVRAGGSNLLGNSGFLRHNGSVPTGWGVYNNGGISTTTSVQAGGQFGQNYFRITANAATTQTLGAFVDTGQPEKVTSWDSSQIFCISFWARGSGGAVGQKMNGLPRNSGWTSNVELENPPLTANWQRYVWRVQPDSGVGTTNGELYLSWFTSGTLASGSVIDICCPKVELGSQPSAWAPSHRDPVSPANPITSSNVSTYISSAAIGSAQVGVLTAGNLTVTALSNTVNGSTSSGGRVEVQTNKVLVYDASNVLRVKLGYLL